MTLKKDIVISGLGVIAPGAIGKNDYFKRLQSGAGAFTEISLFDCAEFPVKLGAEIKDFHPAAHLNKTKIRNLDRNALLLITAAQLALRDANITVTEENTDEIGVCTGTTFSHLWSVHEFDKEVFSEGLDFASPALFPSTVLNAASSHVSIYFNIQGFNTTINTGYTSALESLKYAMNALATGRANQVLVGCVDTLSYTPFWGFNKLGFMAGLKGEAVSCPFDKRRNGPLLGEGAVVLVLETEQNCARRNGKALCRILGTGSYFDAYRIGKIHPKTEGLITAIKHAMRQSAISPEAVDYVSSCANSSKEGDLAEIKALKEIFGAKIKKLPISSIKSMFGETMAASGGLQIASVLGAMERDFLPPTINYKLRDPEIDIDCVPGHARQKEVKIALIDSFGPGGYNSTVVLQKI